MKRATFAAACALDVTAGDPPQLPHPVQIIGRAIESGERWLRARIPAGDARAETTAGALLAACTVGGAAAAAGIALWLGGAIAEVTLGAGALAARSLDDGVGRVENALARGDVIEARTRLAEIVGRDTHDLDASEIARAALETAAESLCDGVIAPLLALRLGGIAGAWAFKAASTLDSMVGHPESPYRHFGFASAKLDDCLNFIPARLTVLAVACAAALAREAPLQSLAIALRDGCAHRSPNAGWCEAALAGALQLRLGGDNRYDGVLMSGPIFGPEYPRPGAGDIARGRRVVRIATFLSMAAIVASFRS